MCKLNVRQAEIDLVAEGIEEYATPSFRLGYFNWKYILGDVWSPELYSSEEYLTEEAANDALLEKADELYELAEPLFDEYDCGMYEPQDGIIEATFTIRGETEGHEWSANESAYVWVEEVK